MPPAGATPLAGTVAGLGCGMATRSDPAGADPTVETGLLTGGPFVVADAAAVTVTCTVSVGNAVVGDQAPPAEVAVTATSPGSVGSVSGAAEFAAPAGAAVYLCTAITWSGADGTPHLVDLDPPGPGGECDLIPETVGAHDGKPGPHGHNQHPEPSRSGGGTPPPPPPPPPPLPPCDATNGHAEVSPLSSTGDATHYVWTASVHASVDATLCPPGVYATITITDTSSFGQAYTHTESSGSPTFEVTATSHGPDVPYVGRATAHVEVTASAYNSADGSGLPFCSETVGYDVTYTPSGPDLSAPTPSGNCTP